MQHTVSATHGQHTVTLNGKITFSDHGAFKQLITQLEAARASRVIIDIAGVDYIDSAAIGMFLLLRDQLGGDSARIMLAHPRGLVKKVLLLSNFDKLFELQE